MNENQKGNKKNENRYKIFQVSLEEEEEDVQLYQNAQIKESDAVELKKHEERITHNINNIKSEDINSLIKKCNEVNDECVLEGEHWAQVESNEQHCNIIELDNNLQNKKGVSRRLQRDKEELLSNLQHSTVYQYAY